MAVSWKAPLGALMMIVGGCSEAPEEAPRVRDGDGLSGTIDAAMALPIGETDGVRGYLPVTAAHNSFQVTLVEDAPYGEAEFATATLAFATDAGEFEVAAAPSVEGTTLLFELGPEEIPPPGVGSFRVRIGGDTLQSPDAVYFAIPGDSNLDLSFDSSDLVDSHAAGKYETGEPATFAEGDWNGDGVYDSGDLVAAFAFGAYEMGPVEGIELAAGLHWVGDRGDGATFRTEPICELSCGMVVKDFRDLNANANIGYLEELIEQGADAAELNMRFGEMTTDAHSGSVTLLGNGGAGCQPNWEPPPVGDPESHVSSSFNWCGAGLEGEPGFAAGGVKASYDCSAEQQAAIECTVVRRGDRDTQVDPCKGAEVAANFELDVDLNTKAHASLDIHAEEGAANATSEAMSTATASLFQSSANEASTGQFTVSSQAAVDGSIVTCAQLEGVTSAYTKAFCRFVGGMQVSKSPLKLEAWCAVEGGGEVRYKLEDLRGCITSDGLDSNFTMELIDGGLSSTISVPAGGVTNLGRSAVSFHTEYEIDRPLVLFDDGIVWDEYGYQRAWASIGAGGHAGGYISSFIPAGTSDSLRLVRKQNRPRRPRLFEQTDAEGNATTRMYFEEIRNGASVSCPEPNIPGI